MRDQFDLIIFDWDGTLMDSEAKIIRCFAEAIDDVGAPDPGPEAVRDIIGLGLKEALDKLLPDSDETTRQAVVERYREHFLHLDQTEMNFFPGVLEGLHQLTEQGYKLAVATGKARRGLDRLLKQWDIGHLFHATRCADESGSKPHPRMLYEILEQTTLPVERSLMVGDTTYDLEMAKNAGMRSLAVSYGVHDCNRLSSYAQLGCMPSFQHVYDWLANG